MGSETKNGVAAAAAQFPPMTKKIIQSLKEIVNCPEPEIYSVLKECNMDPSDAVQRLLSLGFYAAPSPFYFSVLFTYYKSNLDVLGLRKE